MLAGRFLQAFGGAAGPVLGRAAVRDIYGPVEAGRVLSYMASTMAMAPALAPVLGAGLLLFLGWESVFLLLAVYAAVMLGILILMMPEPLPADRRQSMAPRVILANYRMLLTQRSFVGYQFHDGTSRTMAMAIALGGLISLAAYLGLIRQRSRASRISHANCR